jgi:hypothetical protein
MNPLGVGTRPEIALLLSCSRATIDSKHADRVKEISRNNIDWSCLLRLAERHGLMPLLFHHLNSICPEAVPGPILSRLKNYFNANLGYNRFLTGELLRLLNLFENHGIPGIPFKGPVLASLVYGDIGLREFLDLDILIHKKDFMKVKSLLLSEGYVSVDGLNADQDEALIRSLHDYHFKHTKTGVDIDIHWGFVPKEFSSTVNADRLWPSIQVARLGGEEIQTLTPEDLLLILCIHGYKHCWEALGWICDVAGLIQTHQKMDWKGVMEEAARVDSERVLSLGLYLAKKLLNANLPDGIWQKIQSDTKVRLLAWEVSRHLFQDRDKPLGIYEKSLFHIKSMSHRRDIVRYGFYFLIPPTSRDYKILELPSSLFFLYYLLRPFRLLGKYSVGRLINSLLDANASISKE